MENFILLREHRFLVVDFRGFFLKSHFIINYLRIKLNSVFSEPEGFFMIVRNNEHCSWIYHDPDDRFLALYSMHSANVSKCLNDFEIS